VNDFERTKEMLTRAKVVFEELEEDGQKVLAVKAKGVKHPSNKGYYRFFTEFTFTPEGALVSVGVWE